MKENVVFTCGTNQLKNKYYCYIFKKTDTGFNLYDVDVFSDEEREVIREEWDGIIPLKLFCHFNIKITKIPQCLGITNRTIASITNPVLEYPKLGNVTRWKRQKDGVWKRTTRDYDIFRKR